MANARNLSTLAQGASTAGILAGTYGGTGASLSPTTAGNVIFTADGSVWSSTQKIVRGTSVATTSGTAIDFTGIPSWVKRITVMLNGVSTNGTSRTLVQIGTSSGIESTGYSATSNILDGSGGSAASSSTTGFVVLNETAGAVMSGALVIYSFSGNSWVSNHTLQQGDNVRSMFGGGNKSLSGTLDRIRLTTTNGTDTFDAGSVNILYE